MDIKKILLTENDCYKSGRKIEPKGIIVHSTGANNKKLNRYIAPDDGIIGANRYNNHWNRPGVRKCVHAFVGVDASGVVRVYQTLPFDMRCWGIGSGKHGSYNDNYLQFEICEDDLTDEGYFNAAFAAAADLCAFLMGEFPAIKIENVISHNEGYKRGFGSSHKDCDHWLARFGKNMDWFRDQVEARRGNGGGSVKEEAGEAEKPDAAGSLPYRVRINVDSLNVRAGAGVQYKIKTTVSAGEVYTIVEESNGWGKLKSGAGWISLYYTVKL